MLGAGFALVVPTATPAATFAKLPLTPWDSLGARRVAVLPVEAAKPFVVPGVAVVRETDGAIAQALAPYEGRALLLRPDHYVAGALAFGDGHELDALIDGAKAAQNVRNGSHSSPEPVMAK